MYDGFLENMEKTDDLVAQLCTHVGMIMEDQCMLALTISSLSDNSRSQALAQLASAASDIDQIIRAAISIHC